MKRCSDRLDPNGHMAVFIHEDVMFASGPGFCSCFRPGTVAAEPPSMVKALWFGSPVRIIEVIPKHCYREGDTPFEALRTSQTPSPAPSGAQALFLAPNGAISDGR